MTEFGREEDYQSKWDEGMEMYVEDGEEYIETETLFKLTCGWNNKIASWNNFCSYLAVTRKGYLNPKQYGLLNVLLQKTQGNMGVPT